MARSRVNKRVLDKEIRKVLRKNATVALAAYNKQVLEHEKPSNPFAGTGETTNPANQVITDIPGGIRISVLTLGAEFLEFGNEGGARGSEIVAKDGSVLKIRAKNKNSKLKSGQKARVGSDGSFFYLKKVKTFGAQAPLLRSVLAAFPGSIFKGYSS